MMACTKPSRSSRLFWYTLTRLESALGQKREHSRQRRLDGDAVRSSTSRWSARSLSGPSKVAECVAIPGQTKGKNISRFGGGPCWRQIGSTMTFLPR